MIRRMNKTGGRIIKKIIIGNEAYPEILKSIPNPPKQLYVLGDEKILSEKSVAIIGSRVCTEEGAKIAEKFAKELSKNGICIISGMAKGIDTAAHIGALKAGGKTIAVLGSGFKHIFPKENKKLFESILENGGAVLSEYDENTKPEAKGFIKRNRIVSGLSEGVLIIEAKYRSGTAITADFARKQGKKIFCIPHSLEQKEGIGTNRQIQNGAKLVISPQEIIEELEIKVDKTSELKETEIEVINVPDEYIPIYKYITEKPINIDEICKKTKMEISKVNYILTMLELEGYIEQLPGKFFVR